MIYKLTFSDRCYRRTGEHTINYIGQTFETVKLVTDYTLTKFKHDIRFLAPREADECEMREYLTNDIVSVEAWGESWPDKKTKTYHPHS